jgi:hypothetical protein
LDGLVLVALVGLILLWVGPAFLPGKVLLPLDIVTQFFPPWQQPDTARSGFGLAVNIHNLLLFDVVDYIYPVKAFMAEAVKEGVLPLWNPYVLGGYPLTYNTQAGLWYPLSVLYYVLEPVTAVDLTIFLQLLLGGSFMFAYLRQLHLRRAAAFLGVVLFLFNGMMVVWLEWQVVQAAVIWLPLCLYFVERAAKKLETRNEKLHNSQLSALNHPQYPLTDYRLPITDALLAGFAFAMPWLGGHWNWALYGSITAVVYILWRFGRSSALWGLLILAVGVGLSAIQVLPAFVYLSQGHRQPYTLAESLALGLKDRAIVALIPDFFGTPLRLDWWGPTNYNESAFYLGILPLFLAVLAPFLRRDGVTRFYAVWGVVGLLLALGTPLYALLWALPVFDGLWPSRAAMVVVFCAAVLSALALDRMMDTAVNWRRVRWLLLATTAVILVIFARYIIWYRPAMRPLTGGLLWFGAMLLAALVLLLVRPRLKPRLFAGLAILLVVLDLFWVWHDFNTIGDTANLYPETATTRFLHSDPEPYRIASLPEGIAYPPNTNLPDRLSIISGYEPAVLQSWVDYLSAAEAGNVVHSQRMVLPFTGLQSPLLDAVNIKYVVANSEWQRAGSTPALLHEANKTRVYLNENYFPRAYLVPQALIAPDVEMALARVLENQARLDEVVVLEMETQVDAYTPQGRGTARSRCVAATPFAVITDYQLNQVTIRTETDGPAYLVLADTYYPGWRVTIDGERAEIYRANSVVRATAVPEGTHEVIFTFRPVDFYVGAGVTAVTLLSCLVMILWHRRSLPIANVPHPKHNPPL